MDIGSIFDKTFRLIFNKKYLILSIIFIFIFSILLFAGIALVYLKNSPPPGFLFFLDKISNSLPYFIITISIISLIFLFILIIFSAMTIDFFLKKFFNKEWKLKGSFNSPLKKIINSFIYFILVYSFLALIIYLYYLTMRYFPWEKVIDIFNYIPRSLITIILFIIISMTFLSFFYLIYTFISPSLASMIHEKKTIFKSMFHSIKLVKKNYWRIFGINLLFFLILLFTYVILLILFLLLIQIINNLILQQYNSSIETYMIFYIIFFLYGIISIPLTSLSTILFLNQKLRVEGLGVELLIDSFLEKNIDEDKK